MRKAGRACAVVSLTALALPLAPGVAMADSTSEAAATGAYFWKGKLPSVIGGQPNPINGQDTDNDGVARDDLGVALVERGTEEEGQEPSNKETFLAWDLMELADGDTITKFVVTVVLSEKGPNPDPAQNTVQSREKEALLRACSPTGGFGPTDAGAYDTKPDIDYATCVPGAFDAEKNGYVFDVTSLTSTWLTTANNGIAIIPDKPNEQAPFQVVFQPAAAHMAEIEYTPGPDSESDLTGSLGSDTTDLGSTTSDFGSSSTGSSDSFLSSAPSSSFSGGSGSGSLSSIDTALPETAAEEAGPAPDVAEQQVRTAPVAQRSVGAGPPVGFWLLAVVLAGALVVMSLATGSPVTPAAARARAGRVLDTVQRRALTRRAT